MFYKIGPTLLYLYLDHGLSVAKLGEEARVSLTDFSMDGPTRRNLRRVWRKIVDDGCSFEVIPAEQIAPLLPELRAVSDAWLTAKQEWVAQQSQCSVLLTRAGKTATPSAAPASAAPALAPSPP